jgi:hypothetical protein
MLVVLKCMRVVAAQAPQRDVAVAVGWGHHEGGSRMRVPKTCLR